MIDVEFMVNNFVFLVRIGRRNVVLDIQGLVAIGGILELFYRLEVFFMKEGNM